MSNVNLKLTFNHLFRQPSEQSSSSHHYCLRILIVFSIPCSTFGRCCRKNGIQLRLLSKSRSPLTDYRDQNEFIKTLGESLLRKTDTSRLIIAGDWNCTLQCVDKREGLPWKSTDYREAVVNLMDELNLVDIYRNLHPSC